MKGQPLSVFDLPEGELNLHSSARRLTDRVAVITGVATGIGRATSLLFAAHGATVVGIDNNADAGRRTVAEVNERFGLGMAEFVEVDVGVADQVRTAAGEVMARHPRIDVLFNNAGVIEPFDTPLEDLELDRWSRILAVNLTGPLLCSTAFLPGLKASGRGSIIHNSSIDGVLGNAHVPLYSVSKGGLTPMTHVMSLEFGRLGIRVNAILPGAIETEMTATTLNETIRQDLVRATPLGRMGTPMEVARLVLFLASDEASYVTGAMIPVEAGRTGITQGTA